MAKTSTKKADQAVKLDTGRLEQVEFGELAVSPLNVRKNAEVGPDDELVASIKAHGLLQPLVGYIAKSGPAIVLICAGQRRFLALQHIAQADTKIPVRIVDEETAIEVSLAENLERKDMNPADELAAFQALIETGHYDADRIAARFGFNLRLVRRRLKMATLIPEILEALRDGRITVEAAEVYAAASEEVQRDVFKKHNAKGAWEPHKPDRVRGDIVIHGMNANSQVGRFIGGIEAYKAAGGTMLDENFLDLFKTDEDNQRMRDVSVVRALVEKRQDELHDDVMKMVLAKYPFATGIEWANLFGTYGVDYPKPAKKSGLVLVGDGWNSDATLTADRAREAAEKHGATVLAVMSIDNDGAPKLWEGKFIVGKDGWEKTAPPEKAATSPHNGMTPEERAAYERERAIRETCENLYVRQLIGDTPGFATAHVLWDRHYGHLHVSLARLDSDNADIDFSDQWNPRIKDELLAPFRAEAIERMDADAAARKAKAEEQQVAREKSLAELDELAKKPIAEWPYCVRITYGDDDDTLEIVNEGERLLVTNTEGEEWDGFDAAEQIQLVRDGIGDEPFTITTIATATEYGAAEAGEELEAAE
jgi:ParB/RepB/Spo0J family partition protein